jgi:maltodextrin utilization protein YvdJ
MPFPLPRPFLGQTLPHAHLFINVALLPLLIHIELRDSKASITLHHSSNSSIDALWDFAPAPLLPLLLVLLLIVTTKHVLITILSSGASIFVLFFTNSNVVWQRSFIVICTDGRRRAAYVGRN